MSNALTLGERLSKLDKRKVAGFYAVIGEVQEWAKDQPMIAKIVGLSMAEAVKKLVTEAISEYVMTRN